MHPNSYQIMTTFKQNFLAGQTGRPLKILDVGSQDVNGAYRPLFTEPGWVYHGLDLTAGPNVDIVPKNAYNWSEIRSGSYDVVISGQTFEHTEYFWLTMLEMARVLKSDGWCCIIAPSTGPEHRYPVDCYRFYVDGMVALTKFAGLQVRHAETQWRCTVPDDGNIMWHDSVLVAQKPKEKLWQCLRRSVQRQVLRWSAAETEADTALPVIAHAPAQFGDWMGNPDFLREKQALIKKQQAEINSLLQVCAERETLIHQLSTICAEREAVILELTANRSRRRLYRLLPSRLRQFLKRTGK